MLCLGACPELYKQELVRVTPVSILQEGAFVRSTFAMPPRVLFYGTFGCLVCAVVLLVCLWQTRRIKQVLIDSVLTQEDTVDRRSILLMCWASVRLPTAPPFVTPDLLV